jgi:hypothetical protein
VDVAKVCKRLFRKISCLAQPSIIIKVSLAYYIIGKSVEQTKGIGRFKRCWSLALLRSVCNKSAASTNKRGERGSPCLTPLLQWKVFPGTPFRRMVEIPELKIEDIHCNQVALKPLCSIICNIVWCSILSNAFSKSNLRIMSSFCDLW